MVKDCAHMTSSKQTVGSLKPQTYQTLWCPAHAVMDKRKFHSHSTSKSKVLMVKIQVSNFSLVMTKEECSVHYNESEEDK